MTMNFDPRFSARNFSSVGTRPIRPDGVDKVTFVRVPSLDEIFVARVGAKATAPVEG